MEDDHHSSYIDLFEAIAQLDDASEAKNFFTDLCTPAEIKAFIERWRVCQLLKEKKYSYRQINEITGASLTTIGRVARFLNEENHGGYQTVLRKLQK